MSDSELQGGLDFALEQAIVAATRAGDLIVEWSHLGSYDVSQKSRGELVTTADLRSDEIIR